MTDWLTLHKDKKTEMSELFERMKADQELLTNVDFVLKDAKKKAIDNVIGVAGNRPLVFATFVEAALNRADEKIEVSSEDESQDTALIEDAIRRMFRQANAKRLKQSFPLIEPYLDQQNCRRGRSMLRIQVQELINEHGKPSLDIDIKPWDTRYATCEPGDEGLAWGAYETQKPKAMIESEKWWDKRLNGFEIVGKSAIVVDIWTPEENIIYVDGQKVYEQGNPYGFTPLVYQIVPVGSMMADEKNMVYEGESIFHMIRHLIPEFNRAVSIIQTENMRTIKGATQQAVDDPTNANQVGDYEEINAMGANTGVKTPGAITPILYNKSYESMVLMLRELTRAIDDGSLSSIMLGNLPGPMSAIALVQIEQGQGQVYMPRLGNRGLTKQFAAEMLFREIQSLGLSTIEIGARGHKKIFQTSKFEGEYDINLVYANKSPETDFARLSMAKQYRGVLDEETILADILKRDDPEGDLRKIRRERLRAISPTLQVFDGLKALAEIYEDGDESVKAEIMIVEAELGVDIDVILAGKLPVGANKGQVEAPETMAITAGGGRSSAGKAADLIRSPLSDIEGEVNA